MVVEDEVLIRVLICDSLRDAGARVIEAENADEALWYLRADPAVVFVFTDVRMPGTMDGVELLRRIASDFPNIRTALTSGHLHAADVPGETVFFAKPYQFDDVAGRLIDLLGKAAAY